MRGHVNIQVHNIMAVESDGNTGNGALFHNGIAAVIDAFKGCRWSLFELLIHAASATACFHCKIHMNNHRFSCHRTVA